MTQPFILQNFITLIPALPFLGFLINGFIALQQSRGKGFVGKGITSFVACLMPLLSFGIAVFVFWTLKSNPTVAAVAAPQLLDWMILDHFTLSFGLIIDHLSSVMTLIITGVGFLIHWYSTSYMHEDDAYARYMAYINLFLFFMLTLVMADSLVLLFVGWEGVGLCSYLLIGFWFTDSEKAQAGKKAFVVNRIGDFAFLLGMFLVAATLLPQVTDSEAPAVLSFSFITAHADWLLPLATPIALCLFFGATGKSAQIPLYVWLPDAMAGPTPVSALIHAATMVTAGIYLVARMGFLFLASPFALHVVLVIGLATAIVSALIAVTQFDIKKVLAYSTVSQLGFMVMALGVGGFSSAIFHVMTHAFFKACLFLGAGSVIHSLHHEQDIRHMGGLLKRMPITGITFLISTLAIAGVPPLSGFFSKDEILYLIYAHAGPWYYTLALFAAGLTAFYMMRLFVYTFVGQTRAHHPNDIHESPLSMTVPLIVLAFLATIAGGLGLPHILGQNHLGEWLSFLGPAAPHHIENSVLQEKHLMLISAFWGLLCLGVSYLIFTRAHHITTRLKERCQGIYSCVNQKFKIDELYNALLVQPIKAISNHLLFKTVDVKLIDGFMVNGFGDVSQFMSRTFSAMQSGMIGTYLFYLFLGLCLMLGFFVL